MSMSALTVSAPRLFSGYRAIEVEPEQPDNVITLVSRLKEAAEGIRTLDLLHGKQSMGLSWARKTPANERLPTR